MAGKAKYCVAGKTRLPIPNSNIQYAVDDNGCWLVGKAKVHQAQPVNGVVLGCHVASFVHFKGPVPAGHLVRHSCDVPNCVNPDHLMSGTHLDNMQDKHNAGHTPRGDDHANTKLSEADVEEVRRLYSIGTRQTDLARKYGVDKSLIHRIVHGKIRL